VCPSASYVLIFPRSSSLLTSHRGPSITQEPHYNSSIISPFANTRTGIKKTMNTVAASNVSAMHQDARRRLLRLQGLIELRRLASQTFHRGGLAVPSFSPLSVPHPLVLPFQTDDGADSNGDDSDGYNDGDASSNTMVQTDDSHGDSGSSPPRQSIFASPSLRLPSSLSTLSPTPEPPLSSLWSSALSSPSSHASSSLPPSAVKSLSSSALSPSLSPLPTFPQPILPLQTDHSGGRLDAEVLYVRSLTEGVCPRDVPILVERILKFRVGMRQIQRQSQVDSYFLKGGRGNPYMNHGKRRRDDDGDAKPTGLPISKQQRLGGRRESEKKVVISRLVRGVSRADLYKGSGLDIRIGADRGVMSRLLIARGWTFRGGTGLRSREGDRRSGEAGGRSRE
jgi:hypothetical protein